MTAPGNAGKVLQIVGSVIERTEPQYPWFTAVTRGLRTWRAAQVLFNSFTPRHMQTAA